MDTPNPTLKLLGKEIIFSTLVQYVGRALQIVIAAMSIKLVSNFLGTNNYGIYASITEYALFFSVVANLGIFANVIRQMSISPDSGKIFINALYLRIVTGLVFFLFGIIVLIIIGNNIFFTLCVAIFFGVLLLDFMTSVCDGMLQANYMMGRATFALVLWRIIALISIYEIIQFVGHSPTLGENFHGIILVLISLVIGSALTFLLSFYFVAKKIHLHWQVNWKCMWSMFRVGLPFGIINVINSLYFRFLPDYFSHMALTSSQFATFSISFRIAQIVSLLSTFLMFSALPGLREYIDQRHWQKVRALYSKIITVLISAGIIVFIIGSLLGPTILTLVTQKEYFLPEFWFVLPLMLLLAAISYGYDLILITLFAFDKTKWLLSREYIALALALIFFTASLSIDNTQWKILAIIVWAIAGESTMVISGLLKIRKLLRDS